MTSVYEALLKRKRLQILFIILATVLVYSNIFQNDFVWDDFNFIFEWEAIREFRNIPELLGGSLPESHIHTYRPLRSFFYLLSYKIWGLNSLGYHLQAILIHLSLTLLVFYIVGKITKDRLTTFVATLLFAVHPVHTESITFITASFDGIGIIFLLSAFSFYLKARESGNKKIQFYALSFIFTMLAAFSYEISLILPLLMILYDICFRKVKLRDILSRLWVYLIFLVPLVSYVIIRFVVLGIQNRSIYLGGNFWLTMQVMVEVLTRYLKLVFTPLGLNFIHTIGNDVVVLPVKSDITLSPTVTPQLIFGVLILLSLLVMVLVFYKRQPVISFSIGWFFISLLPVLNFIPNAIIMAERYLYIPSMSAMIVVGLSMTKLSRLGWRFSKQLKLLVALLILFISISYMSITYARNRVWKDELSLWSDVARKSPKSVVAITRIAKVYEEKGQFDKALGEYKKAKDIDPTSIVPRNNLAGVHSILGNYEQAEEELKGAIRVKNDIYFLHYNLGLVYEKKGLRDLARSEYEQALKIKPESKLAQQKIASFKQD